LSKLTMNPPGGRIPDIESDNIFIQVPR
jgi:hypothetical protein